MIKVHRRRVIPELDTPVRSQYQKLYELTHVKENMGGGDTACRVIIGHMFYHRLKDLICKRRTRGHCDNKTEN